MPPQEGVNMRESFQEAIRRCLAVECCLDLPADEREFSRMIHMRSFRYAGELRLSKERHGERLVADDAVGTWLEHVVLKRKAYWIATMLIASQSDLTPSPDGKEIVDLRWYDMREARDKVVETNQHDKAQLLIRVLDACEKDLLPKTRSQHFTI